MNITHFTGDLDVIAALADNPTESASELKAKFDEGPKALGDYLNQTLIPELEAAVPDVVDALTSTSATAALSANQGRALNAAIPLVIDSLSSASTLAALSANQGRALSVALSAKQKAITCGAAAPAGGADGDIYIRY